MDPVADLKGKEIKRATLNEIVDYITAGRGVLTEAVYPEIIRMVNIHPLKLGGRVTGLVVVQRSRVGSYIQGSL